jgi:hypothetical protein
MKEITFKQWVYAEAAAEGVSAAAIYNRFNLGKYPRLKLRRVNKRVVFVKVPCSGGTRRVGDKRGNAGSARLLKQPAARV